MRVTLLIDDRLGPAGLTDLLQLIRAFAAGRHDLVSSPADIAALGRYLRLHAPMMLDAAVDLARKSTVATTWSVPETAGAIVEIDPGNMGERAADLCQPAIIVVENAESDGVFVAAIAKAFNRGRVTEAIRERWLVIESGGGGGEVPKVARSKRKAFAGVSRVMVLLDSDRWFPGQQTKAHRIARALALEDIRVHVLELREAENYIPNKVLSRAGNLGNVSQRLNYLKRLSADQRGHFDMKHGFGSGGQVRAEHNGLYSDLGHQVVHGLREGFGRNVLLSLSRWGDTLSESDFASLGEAVAPELRQLLNQLCEII